MKYSFKVSGRFPDAEYEYFRLVSTEYPIPVSASGHLYFFLLVWSPEQTFLSPAVSLCLSPEQTSLPLWACLSPEKTCLSLWACLSPEQSSLSLPLWAYVSHPNRALSLPLWAYAYVSRLNRTLSNCEPMSLVRTDFSPAVSLCLSPEQTSLSHCEPMSLIRTDLCDELINMGV